MIPAPFRPLAASVAMAVPWCCIMPAALAVSGVARAGAASWIQAGTPLLLAISAAIAARAVYLSWARRSGRPWSRVVVALSLPVIVGLWWFRLGFAS